MPTLTGDGVIVQYRQYLYQLNCDAVACNWETLEKELSISVSSAVAMILPAEYTCKQEQTTTPGIYMYHQGCIQRDNQYDRGHT